MRIIYSVVSYLLLPIFILRLLWRSIKAPAYRSRILERLGFIPLLVNNKKPIVWLHTVSVGETIAAKSLVKEFLKSQLHYSLMITTTTPTGSAQVLSLFSDEIEKENVQHCYMPYDLPDCIGRFLRKVKPSAAIFMETEVWPNTLAICYKNNIKTLLVNARLSEKSLRGYQRFNALSQGAFSLFDSIAAQSQADADRIVQLGGKNISVTGSIKLDIDIDASLVQEAKLLKEEWSNSGRRKVIIAASTHAGEDEVILRVYKELLKNNDQLLLVLVPRHPERFDAVKQLCFQNNLTTISRSEKNISAGNVNVIFGDTMGEMMLLYGAADIAIVCGSFVDHGGHNMLEPAVWGLPLLSGSSVFNFAKIADDMQKRQALLLVDDEQQLLENLHKLVNDDELSSRIGLQAKQYIDDNKGALDKVLLVIMEALDPKKLS